MLYYSISPDLYCYPQIKGFGDTIFISNPRHIFHFLDKYAGVRFTTSPPKWAPHLDYLVLNPRLRKKGPSDVLSEYLGITNGFIISSKFKALLEGLILSPHVYYPCRIELDGVFWDYHYLFFYGHLSNYICFPKSPILIFKWRDSELVGRVEFDSFESYKSNYLKKKPLDGYYGFEKIVFNAQTPFFDMMSINNGGDTRILISEILREIILKNKVTNVKIDDVREGYIEYIY